MTMQTAAPVTVDGWVQLELLGHRVGYGHLTVVQVGPCDAGPILFRFDVPAVEGKAHEAHYYTPAAVYGIHPTTEAAVIEALTPYRDCGAQLQNGEDFCTLRAGHDGVHEGLPF